MLLLDIKFEVHCTRPGGCHSKLRDSSVQNLEYNEYAARSLQQEKSEISNICKCMERSA